MKIALGVVGALLAAIAAGLGWLGAFSSVDVVEREMGPYEFVYVAEASTDPARIGELTHALDERLEAAGVTGRKPAQEYYPPARGIPNQVGLIVDKLGGFMLGTETFYRAIPVQRYMVVTFPFRNPLSFAVGAMRVLPAFQAHRQQQKYAETSSMVILDGDRILYLEPIAPA